MLRFLQVNHSKNIPIMKAGAALTRGAVVTLDYTDDTVDAATDVAPEFLVDAVINFDGLNAAYANDASYEAIASGAKCLAVPCYVGERYATTELTIGSLSVGDGIKGSAGKFVAAATNDVVCWRYGGTYADPTGKTMYIVEKVPAFKA